MELSAPAKLFCAAWSPDGRSFAAGCEDGFISIWDLGTRVRRATREPHRNSVSSVGFSHAGDLLASTSLEGVLRLWDAPTGRQLIKRRGSGYQIQYSPDDRILAPVVEGSKFCALEIASHSEFCRLAPQPPVRGAYGLAFSPDGLTLAAANEPRDLQLFAAATGRRLAILEAPTPVGSASVCFSPDGTTLAVLEWNGAVQVWDLRRIRAQLAELNLDWDQPSFPQASGQAQLKPLSALSSLNPSVSQTARFLASGSFLFTPCFSGVWECDGGILTASAVFDRAWKPLKRFCVFGPRRTPR